LPFPETGAALAAPGESGGFLAWLAAVWTAVFGGSGDEGPSIDPAGHTGSAPASAPAPAGDEQDEGPNIDPAGYGRARMDSLGPPYVNSCRY
jgi:hypothetical protein